MSCPGRTETVSVAGVLLAEDETESQVLPPLDVAALTENRIGFDAKTEMVCCWTAVLPACAVNESEDGETDRFDWLCSAHAERIPIGIIAESRTALRVRSVFTKVLLIRFWEETCAEPSPVERRRHFSLPG